MSHFLVTGARGFVGRELVDQFLEKEHGVTGLAPGGKGGGKGGRRQREQSEGIDIVVVPR